MKDHEFTLVLKSDPEDELTDQLYGAIDDGTLVTSCGVAQIDFTREAESLEAAILSAIADVRSVGIEVERVELQAEF